MSLFNTILRQYLINQLPDIDKYRQQAIPLQHQVFNDLIKKATNTEFGKKHHFSEIKNHQQFCKNIPLHSYNEIKPYIDRMIEGEQNILWPSHIKWFSKSSGTTSERSKYIPVSNESLKKCHYRGGRDVLSSYCDMFPETSIFKGKGLILGGSMRQAEQNSKASYGDLSAILIHNFPRWADFIRTPSREIALMDEWESKLELMSDFVLPQNITSLSGVPSWMLLLLKKVLEKSGKKNIKEVWPNLELFMHGGVNFEPYHDQYDEIIPKGSIFYLQTYNASEGFFAFQDQRDHNDMLLVPNNGIYFEFIPLHELEMPNPTSYPLESVEIGVNYAIIISTNAGLWRYIIGDTVQFTSLYPHRIRITGRTSSFINAFGEEVIIENAEKAIAEACKKTNAIISEYTAAPVYFAIGTKAAHEWVIEFEEQPNDWNLFCKTLDISLKAVNSDYEAKRYHNLILQEPIVQNAPKGTFIEWLTEKGKLGGQNKVPRLSNNRKIIDEVIEVINKL
jgi:hypothetical protein